MSEVQSEPKGFRFVRIVMPDGSAFVHHTFQDHETIRVPAFNPVLGLGYVHLQRHEAFGMVWYQEAGRA